MIEKPELIGVQRRPPRSRNGLRSLGAFSREAAHQAGGFVKVQGAVVARFLPRHQRGQVDHALVRVDPAAGRALQPLPVAVVQVGVEQVVGVGVDDRPVGQPAGGVQLDDRGDGAGRPRLDQDLHGHAPIAAAVGSAVGSAVGGGSEVVFQQLAAGPGGQDDPLDPAARGVDVQVPLDHRLHRPAGAGAHRRQRLGADGPPRLRGQVRVSVALEALARLGQAGALAAGQGDRPEGLRRFGRHRRYCPEDIEQADDSAAGPAL